MAARADARVVARVEFSEDDFKPIKATLSDPARLSAALAYYRAMPSNLTHRATWPLLFTPISVPTRNDLRSRRRLHWAEMFEGQKNSSQAVSN